jgi:hypothetical protein
MLKLSKITQTTPVSVNDELHPYSERIHSITV